MKQKLIVLVALLGSIATYAQQDAQFSQWMFNKMDMNPAYTGTDKSLCATALYRNQWVGFDGAPKTVMVSVGGFFPVILGGAGLTVFNDQLGFSSTTIAQLSYSYHWTLGPGTLGIGADAGFLQQSVNGKWSATDPYQSDPPIPATGTNVKTYDLGFGLYYTNPTGMFFGISSTHLPSNTSTSSTIAGGQPYTTSNGTTGLSTKSNLTYELARHYYLMAGWPFNLNADYKLVPSILAKTDGASTQMDLNARIVWHDKYWFGASYRITDAVVAMIGMQMGTLLAGYSYDFTTSNIRNYSSGSHEIVLRYCFMTFKEPVPSEHHNPRFLGY